MKLLLDTQAFLWLSLSPEKIPTSVRKVVNDSSNEMTVSVVSLWEIEIKAASRKLIVPEGGVRSLVEGAAQFGVRILTVIPEHVFALEGMPLHHRDPFDRMIVVQTIAEKALLVSSDAMLRKYDVPILWRGTPSTQE